MVVLAVVAVTHGIECKQNEIFYKPGEFYKDDCNRCICLKSGRGACTKNVCPHKVCEYEGFIYQPGKSFKVDCNTCWCHKDIGIMCSLIGCGLGLNIDTPSVSLKKRLSLDEV
ncbi:Mucin-2 [Mactra antiquata]